MFTNEVLDNMLEGNISIGHVRYSMENSVKKENTQPIVIRHKKGNLAVAHNGNITNAMELKQELEDKGAIFTTTSNAEIICHIIVRERLKAKSTEEAIKNTMKVLKGAYSLIIMSPQKLIACRDPQGFRPLCMGKLGDDIIFSSETCALDICGAEFIRDVKPGEIIVVKDGKISSIEYDTKSKKGLCVFEYIYFTRPDSILEGMSVHEFREKAGRYLAKQNPVDVDLVAAVPDSGVDAALGYSKESKIPYDLVFTKSKYIGRTFIQNMQNKRKNLVALKLNPLKNTIKGKKIVLIDDSIVRGTTLTRIVKTLRRAGAKEIHLRIASPAFIDVCYFGIDINDKENLIANGKSIEEVRKIIGADSLEYLSVENLKNIVKNCGIKNCCMGCFTGKYPVAIPKKVKKDKFEEKITKNI